jgi:SAM-dependent methyltransferase
MNKQEEKEMQCCVTQCDKPLDQSYWEAQWQSGQTGWDIGYASPAITSFMDAWPDKQAAILIPGCGNAYEAEYLINAGFSDITLIDIAQAAVKRLQEKFAGTSIKILCEDFFQHQGKYDLILEQTFFCAIPPSRRKEYAVKMFELLKADGTLAGLLFDKQFDKEGPPFGGCPCEYKPIFEPYFNLIKMEPCMNSIEPRKDSEVFFIMKPKTNKSI